MVFGLFSTGNTVALTLLFDSGATGPVVVEVVPASVPAVVSQPSPLPLFSFGFGRSLCLLCFFVQGGGLLILRRQFRRQTFSATWKLIKVPKRGLKAL